MKPPKSRKAELSPNATGGGKSHAETAESAEFKMTELGPIPMDWEVKRLGEVAMVARGGSPRPIEAFLTSHDDGLNWVKIGDVGVGAKYIERTAEKILPGGLSSTRMVYPGDFLLSNSMSFGRPYIMKIAGCIHDGWLVIQDYKTTFDTEYLYYVLGSEMVVNQYRVLAAGSSVLNLNKDVVARVTVVVPPLAEQRRIAGALSDVDELISALGKLIEKKRNIKTGAMQQLLTGKTRLPGFKGKWVEKRLGECGYCFNGITGKLGSDFGHGVSRYITFLNVLSNVVINPLMFEAVDICSGESQNEVRRGDVFFNTSSETPEEVGLCAVLEDDVKSVYLNSFCFGFRLTDEDVCGRFLAYWFRSSTGRALMTSLAQGSTRYNLSKDAFREAYVCIPPTFAEQREIATVLSDIDAEIAALEADRTKYERIKTGMMQELLTGKTRLKGE